MTRDAASRFNALMAAVDAAAVINSPEALHRALAALPRPAPAPLALALGETLAFCIRNNLSTQMARPLIEAGANPNHAGAHGVDATLVERAIGGDNEPWLRALLSLGADPNGVSARGSHPLSQCAERPARSSLLLAQALIEAGSLPNGPSPEALEALVAQWEGDPIGQQQRRQRLGATPLTRAIWEGSLGLCELLLRSGADPERALAPLRRAIGRSFNPGVQERSALAESWIEREALSRSACAASAAAPAPAPTPRL